MHKEACPAQLLERLPHQSRPAAGCQSEPVPAFHHRFRVVVGISREGRPVAGARLAALELPAELVLARQQASFLEARPGAAEHSPVVPDVLDISGPTGAFPLVEVCLAMMNLLLPDVAAQAQPDVVRLALRAAPDSDFAQERLWERPAASEPLAWSHLVQLRASRQPEQMCQREPSKPVEPGSLLILRQEPQVQERPTELGQKLASPHSGGPQP